MSETDDLALVPIALPRAESLVPTDHLRAIEAREQSRHSAAESGCDQGYAAVACVVLTVVACVLFSAGIGPVLSLVAAWTALGGTISALALGWQALERVGYLWGTRDEKRYLPPDCRAHALDEARLLDTARDLDARILGWNQAIGAMREADEREPRALHKAATARRMLVERHERLSHAASTIQRLAAPAEAPLALPAPSR